jgi:hypothetical protein
MQPSAQRRSTVVLVAVVLASVVLVLIAIAWLNGTSSQRRAFDALNRIGEAANQRTGVSFGECTPSYGFDKRGPRTMDILTAGKYFGNIIRVGFRKFDDQQLIESIPHLQQLPRLTQIGFHSPPDQEQLAKLRTALPEVTFYGPRGKLSK